MIRFRAAVLVAAAAIAVAACTPAPAQLTAQDDGGSVVLVPDQELVISLESNPTTGYRWELDGPTPDMLTQLGEPDFTAQSQAMGAGGTEVWRFRATSPGAGALRLKYWRSFEPTVPPVETFEVGVTVE